jgi:hypothetical protein
MPDHLLKSFERNLGFELRENFENLVHALSWLIDLFEREYFCDLFEVVQRKTLISNLIEHLMPSK